MKLKIFALLFLSVLSLGCSNILQTFSSSELSIKICQTSGDQLQLLSEKLKDTPGRRNIIDTQDNKIVGYLQILSPISYENDSTIMIDMKNLSSQPGEYTLDFELSVQNTYLETRNGEYDRVLVWLGGDCVSLSSGISSTNHEIIEEIHDDSTLFTFNFLVGEIKKIDLSIQSYNIIK